MTDRRSSSGTHFQKEVIAGVDSSHAVRLDGGSTGGIVEAFGADTNISLNVRGKGTGRVVLGNSSQSVFASGDSAALPTFKTWTLAFTIPAMAANASDESTYALSGISTGSYFVFQSQASPASTNQLVFSNLRCSSADELYMTIHNMGSTISGSTFSGTVLEIIP